MEIGFTIANIIIVLLSFSSFAVFVRSYRIDKDRLDRILSVLLCAITFYTGVLYLLVIAKIDFGLGSVMFGRIFVRPLMLTIIFLLLCMGIRTMPRSEGE